MKKNFNALVGIIAILVIAGIALAFSYGDKPTQPTDQNMPSANGSVRLPETVFDATETVPGTQVRFFYPSNGFYGLGAKLTKEASGIIVETTQEYVPEKGSEFVVLSLSSKKLKAGESTLEDVVGAIDENSVDGQYAKLNGEYRTINGRRYFIYKATEDVTVWSAMTIEGNDVIGVSFAYKGSEGEEGQAAYQNNDELFIDILSRIQP
jgi:hypothetical protein